MSAQSFTGRNVPREKTRGDPPLCVDLDGTLILTDLLHESCLKLMRQRPFDLLRIPFWLARGKGVLKRRIAQRTEVDVATLPYNGPLLDWLKSERQAGRRLVLCTASDGKFASAVGSHLGIFDDVLASSPEVNMSGSRKAAALIERYGERGFDYVANGRADLEVWRHARQAIVVNARPSVISAATGECPVERQFPRPKRTLRTWRQVLRLHQWLKNGLLFVPMLAAHEVSDAGLWFTLLTAFLSFSLCASAVYIGNDLLDLESDRAHPRKRNRPFASANVPVTYGILIAPLLLVASGLIASAVGAAFFKCLVAYFAITTAYSLWLKRLVLVDCLTLAGLYTLRIIAGAAAADLEMSFWLLAFSIFFFMSLAFVKRMAELQLLTDEKKATPGRGYLATDTPMIFGFGVAAGYTAVLVLALYINSEALLRLYASPYWVWGIIPLTLFWISWIWLQTHRGAMHDDPLVFAVKDRVSLLTGLALGGVVILGAIGP